MEIEITWHAFPLMASLPLLASLMGATFHAEANNQLPDIGTAWVAALPIEQEVRYGNAFMRFARAGLPIIDDPVLSQYIDDLGQRLLTNADGVRFPFTFFLINDPTINAAAFLGGRVKVHTGLFLYADSESELASVLAHEITHVTQRHIARYMEAQASSSAVTLAGLVGSIALAVINPTAGIAALQTTLGLSMQSAINYTRDNEYEADRIGMKTLYDAGFDPMGMANFFQKLAAEYRYASKPPEMLLTHPLPETRISEARARAGSYGRRDLPPSLDFWLAKVRIQVRFGTDTPQGLLSYFDTRIQKGDYPLKDAAIYGKALALIQLKRTDEADTLMQELASRHPEISLSSMPRPTSIWPRDAVPRPSPASRSSAAGCRTTKWWWSTSATPTSRAVTTRSPLPSSTPMPASMKRTIWPGTCSPMPIARRAG